MTHLQNIIKIFRLKPFNIFKRLWEKHFYNFIVNIFVTNAVFANFIILKKVKIQVFVSVYYAKIYFAMSLAPYLLKTT